MAPAEVFTYAVRENPDGQKTRPDAENRGFHVFTFSRTGVPGKQEGAMDIDELLEQVRAAGITLVVQDGRLRYRPVDRMTPELAAAIREYRDAIIARLSQKGSAGKRENVKTTCERCGEPLRLPESVQLGVCCRCMTEAEWIDTLARMALRREATKWAVERRKAELRKEAA